MPFCSSVLALTALTTDHICMLEQIPTHLIAGPLGAGKTSLIRDLLRQKPAAERWAVLINEFGQIGLDAALLHRDDDGIAMAEVAGGCLCCVNGAPFQVGLGRLLRKARPHRLFIEPSGLGHPLQLLAQLRQAPWIGVLNVQAPLLVLDAAALARREPLPASQQSTLSSAGLLVLNKSEGLNDEARTAIAASLPACRLYWTSQGHLPLLQLPGHDAVPADTTLAVPATAALLGQLWRRPDEPICLTQHQAEGWSIGWRWHPGQRFDLSRIQQWLTQLDWRRAKGVLQAEDGWRSLNAVQGQAVDNWQPSEWRKDSRLELIFAGAQDEAALRAAMAACRLTQG